MRNDEWRMRNDEWRMRNSAPGPGILHSEFSNQHSVGCRVHTAVWCEVRGSWAVDRGTRKNNDE
ncbi:MAG TPA: hypothetical protein PLO78_06650 [Candidatus Omnitrophota bacterium]|nr:hypothetical protein [Candidatus Omnitrophota bacterium]